MAAQPVILRQLCRPALFLTLCGLLSGCFSLSPKPISQQQHLKTVQDNLALHLKDQAAVTESIDLPNAIARTLKYNLSSKVKDAQVALSNTQLVNAKFNLLPEINAKYNYTTRNNSLVSLDKNFTPSDTTVNQRTIEDQGLRLKWNLLDFGLSYVRAQQQADQVLISLEEKRKIQQQLIAQVTVAYWKAYRAQLLYKKILDYKGRTTKALDRSKKAVKIRASSIVTQLEYQQKLIRSMRRLNQQALQLNQAKSTLASLMSLKTGVSFRLGKPEGNFDKLPAVTVPMQALDTVALVYRPELKSATYRTRIAKKGISSAVLQLLPGFNFDYGYNHTSNKYVKHDNWYDTNLLSTWNVMKIFNAPSAIRSAKIQKKITQLTQAALTMGVLSQVRVAYNEYQVMHQDYLYSVTEANNANKLYQQTKRLAKADMSDKQTVTRRGITALNASLQRDLSLARAYESLARLRLSIGLNYIPLTNIQSTPLKKLTKYIRRAIRKEQQGNINSHIMAAYHQAIKP